MGRVYGQADRDAAAALIYGSRPRSAAGAAAGVGGYGVRQVPWEGGRSSPLLAFGAKLQAALVEGNLPLWLHSGK